MTEQLAGELAADEHLGERRVRGKHSGIDRAELCRGGLSCGCSLTIRASRGRPKKRALAARRRDVAMQGALEAAACSVLAQRRAPERRLRRGRDDDVAPETECAMSSGELRFPAPDRILLANRPRGLGETMPTTKLDIGRLLGAGTLRAFHRMTNRLWCHHHHHRAAKAGLKEERQHEVISDVGPRLFTRRPCRSRVSRSHRCKAPPTPRWLPAETRVCRAAGSPTVRTSALESRRAPLR